MNRPGESVGSGEKVDKRVVLFVAAMVSFLTPFMGSSINVAIPSIGKEFAVDAVTLTWIATAYLLAAAMFLVPFGRLADIFGRKKILLFGVTGYTVVSLLCSVTNSENMLIALRALQGFTDAMMFATSMAILTSVYPPRERGRAMGIAVAAVYVGLSLGPTIGGFMTQATGWRSIFLLTAVLGAIVATLIVRNIKGEWAEARGQRMDVVGSVIYSITLFAIVCGFTLLPAVTGVWLIVAGIVSLAAFIWWESRTPQPVLNVGLFRHNVVFALSNLTALINYAATFALGFMLSLYLQFVKGFDPRTTGLILLSQPIMMVIFSPLAGRLSDRIAPGIVASVGMALSTIGLFLVASLTDTSDTVSIVVALLVVGLGFGLFSSPNTNAVMGSVERQYYGVASATVGAMRLIGQALSLGVATLIIAVFVGGAQITPQYHAAFLSGFRLAFIIFAVLCLGGVFASLARGKTRGTAPAGPPPGVHPPAGHRQTESR
ncbi:MAG: MFS transporter [Chloroflexota bacterium]